MKWLQGIILFLLFVSLVTAHEHQVFKIGNKTYSFVIGSLNEPVVVEDKSGIDLRVKEVKNQSGNLSEIPMEGLEKSLKVEVIAGNERQEWSIQAVYGSPGSYKNTIYFSKAIPIAYHLFGSIESVPFDVTFECNMEGMNHGDSDNNSVKIAERVTRLSKSGSFGCPKDQEKFVFPEKNSYQYWFNAIALAGLILSILALRKH
ncbi:MAG: hypothetical protein AABX70_03520 [Nanoarchaeota archaeon]